MREAEPMGGKITALHNSSRRLFASSPKILAAAGDDDEDEDEEEEEIAARAMLCDDDHDVAIATFSSCATSILLRLALRSSVAIAGVNDLARFAASSVNVIAAVGGGGGGGGGAAAAVAAAAAAFFFASMRRLTSSYADIWKQTKGVMNTFLFP